jgi:alpha-beta hydrolase superfamily lysophospholipase
MPALVAPDGTALHYEAFEPTGPRAAVLMLHGWSDHSGRWSAAAERLRGAGFATYLLDWRGHGRSGGRRGHLSRFSQLLGDLQAFRRVVRKRTTAPQVLVGLSFGGLVVLRYLETQPSDAPAGAVLIAPWLGLAFQPQWWKVTLGRLLADLWPSRSLPIDLASEHLSRDPAVGRAYDADPLVHQVMTAGAWREIQWAHRAVPANADRIETPALFLLAGEDRITDSHLARAFADSLRAPVQVRWYPEMYHELLHDPQAEQPLADTLAFLGTLGLR